MVASGSMIVGEEHGGRMVREQPVDGLGEGGPAEAGQIDLLRVTDDLQTVRVNAVQRADERAARMLRILAAQRTRGRRLGCQPAQFELRAGLRDQ